MFLSDYLLCYIDFLKIGNLFVNRNFEVFYVVLVDFILILRFFSGVGLFEKLLMVVD